MERLDNNTIFNKGHEKKYYMVTSNQELRKLVIEYNEKKSYNIKCTIEAHANRAFDLTKLENKFKKLTGKNIEEIEI